MDWVTNVRHIELTATSTGAWAATWGTTIATAETTPGRTEVTARGAEARLGLAVLEVVSELIPNIHRTIIAYLAHVNETTHQALVAKRVDSVLCLLPRSVFHNPVHFVSGRFNHDP